MKWIFLFLAVDIAVEAQGQGGRVAFSDAAFLEGKYNSHTLRLADSGVQKVLAYYFGGSAQSDAIDENPFLKKYFSAVQSRKFSVNDALHDRRFLEPKVIPAEAATALNSVGGIDVTNIANGISAFMIKRAKQELTIAFFNKFQDLANNHPEFGVLFPKTSATLGSLLSYSYPDMIAALRSAFYDDLQVLPGNLGNLLTLPKYQYLLQGSPEIPVVVQCLGIAQEVISQKVTPVTLIQDLDALPGWQGISNTSQFNNFKNMVKLAALFSQSIRNNGDLATSGTTWIDQASFKAAMKDIDLMNLYLGLLAEKAKTDNITFTIDGNPKTFFFLMTHSVGTGFMLETKLENLLNLAGQLQQLQGNISENSKRKPGPSTSDYINYISQLITIVENLLDLAKTIDNKLVVPDNVQMLRQVLDLVGDVYRQQYTQAVSLTINIVDEMDGIITGNPINGRVLDSLNRKENIGKSIFHNASVAGIRKSDIRVMDSILKRNLQDTLITAQVNRLEAVYNLTKFRPILDKINKYGLFIANMASAKSADEVESVMENAVLPVGSSSVKKNSVFNISIQSYLGPNLVLSPPKTAFSSTWTDKFGVTAPIGVSINYGLRKKGSLGLFFSLFDLGAIVDYQLKYDSVITSTGDTSLNSIQKNYQIKLGQIISPGIFFVYGLPWNLPLAIGGGSQYGPGLGKISGSNATVSNNPFWRWNIFLAVDIPFFNLVNVNYKYKIRK